MFSIINPSPQASASQWKPPQQIDPDRAMAYLKTICAIGPRISGTPGMTQQREMLIEFFESQGAIVEQQKFEERHPLTGQPVAMANLIIRWFPDRKERVLICAHYDTRPFPDMDPVNPRGVFIGANDGGSGVAMMQELSHSMPTLKISAGVDFVLFDGEELVYDGQRDPYFLGAEHFSREYASGDRDYTYSAAILVDMIADKDLQLPKERNSFRYAPKLQREVWQIAKSEGIREFDTSIRTEVLDDHLALNEIARIPAIDIIDFQYPRSGRRVQSYWHTTMDVVENCSGESIGKVATVIRAWLETQ